MKPADSRDMFDGKPFPLKCPQCLAIAGWPTQAQTSDQMIVVNFRCRTCDFEWLDSIPTVASRQPTKALPLIERRRTPRYRA
jgi:hypothetical protein